MNCSCPFIRRFFAAAFLTLVVALPSAAQENDTSADVGLAQLQARFADLAASIYPSVVTIAAFAKLPELADDAAPAEAASWIENSSTEYPGYRKIGGGSGFFIHENGEVLTCRHFLLDADGNLADLVSVETEEVPHTPAEVIALEPTLNLAVLQRKVQNGQPPAIRVAKFGDSAASRAGHWAFAVGDPEGPERFFSAGTITSMPRRDCYQEKLTATYLQVATTVHPECYGGPLLNLDGEVIGILMPRSPVPGVAGTTPSYGIEFAMPSKIINGVYQSVRQTRSRQSPWLGFAVMSLKELRKERGAEFETIAKPAVGIFIENVFTGSPAHAAGIQPGDFLVRFNGKDVPSPVAFQKLLYLAGIGSTAELEIFRDDESFVRRLEITERPLSARNR